MSALTILFAGLGASGGLTAIWTVYDGIRKHRAAKVDAARDGLQVIVESATQLVEPLRKQIGELEQQLATDRTTIASLTAELDAARRDLKELKERCTSLEAEATWLRTQVPGRYRPQA